MSAQELANYKLELSSKGIVQLADEETALELVLWLKKNRKFHTTTLDYYRGIFTIILHS